MSSARHAFREPTTADAGNQYARLHHVLELTLQIAGQPRPDGDSGLDRSARVSSAYGDASPVAQRRFDTLVAETSAWAASGLDALACAKDPRSQPRAAAARLAEELERALGDLGRLLRL
jgi:hypothetical protein